MADYWIWWIAAALLVGLELATGTFYLLAVGVAFALGGVAAWLGASLPMQMTIGGTLAVIAWPSRINGASATRLRRRCTRWSGATQ